MLKKEMFPAVEHGTGDAIEAADVFYGPEPGEMLSEDPQDEEKGILPVRNKKVR